MFKKIKSNKTINLYGKSHCKYCYTNSILHAKCNHCEILLHPKNPKYICTGGGCNIQHTLSEDMKYCVECAKIIKEKDINAKRHSSVS